MALLDDGIIVNGDVGTEDDSQSPQPPVNKVTRENDETDGEVKVEAGKEDKPQPGDENNQDDETSLYRVLKGLEYPKGEVHEVDDLLELTPEEVEKFGDGMIEEVEDNL